MEAAHFYADDIQPPLAPFVSVRRTSAGSMEFKKLSWEGKAGRGTCVCVLALLAREKLHVLLRAKLWN